VLLAVVAGAATLAGWPRAAVAWALVAGLAPLLTATEALLPGRSVLDELGLAGTAAEAGAALAGVLAAFVLCREAARRLSPGLAGLGILSALVGTGTTWLASDPSLSATVVGLAALVLLAELGAAVTRGDDFWGPVTGTVATIAEVLALPGVVVGLGWAALATVPAGEPHHPTAVALALLAAAGVVAGLRRAGPSLPGTLAVACAAGAVAAGTGSAAATAVTLLVIAAVGAAWGTPATTPVVTVAAALAPLVAGWMPGMALATGAASFALLLVTAIRSRSAPVALAAIAVGLVTPLAHPSVLGGDGGALALSVVAGAVAVVVLDVASRQLGNLARVATLLLAFGVVPLAPAAGAAVAGLLLALALTDALRLGEPSLAGTAAALFPLAALELAGALDLSTVDSGLFLCVAAIPVTGVAATVDRRWSAPAVATAVVLLAIGSALSATELAAFGTALLVAGGLALGGGLLERRPAVALIGAGLLAAGVEAHLAAAEVGLTEAYIAPVAVLLLALGWAAHGSSWVTDAPAVGLLGGAALLERLVGGGGEHAFIAGAVGVVAVVAGGAGRRAAPLLLGTAILAVLTVTETLAWTAGVPTWAWLAVAGSALLGAGIALERAGTSPVEAGQRVVDVLTTRFS
jgi:hypothetical protein